ncbi:TRAM domain-containing protein [Halobaculum rubrum]|uniref:TRAM domain-containing protein n=1 Tax=Halobaculum rubrum TaxID=2872158 RepID=UPI001CA4184B|nr:TRAM domain-containing protein [Halobaculum rubrum]QZX99262.1 TRAM domain-containing protein [Halobaculum rubrum]
MEISEDLRCVFSAEVERRDGTYVIEVPEREVELDTLHSDRVYRVALLGRHEADEETATAETAQLSTDAGRNGSDSSAATETGRSDPVDTASSPRSNAEQSGDSSDNTAGTAGTTEPEPPVDRGDEVTVDIEGIGDQGDGIARVDRGYVIIVPDTEKGERVKIRVTSVKQNVAFAEVVERVERHHYE